MTFVALLAVGIAAMSASMKATVGEDSSSVTFYKDVLPILQKNCQTCHRPGEIAPRCRRGLRIRIMVISQTIGR
ncbi:MAG: hypothetical protein DMG15_18745 [Acidobacteria bacterium]|nr:MAG: hypothetical protein DMG15_18745 [Acidobacteriota bacterium]